MVHWKGGNRGEPYCDTGLGGVKQWYAVPETRYSTKGNLFAVINYMPRMPDNHLYCVFYLYPSVAAAEVGEAAGGTGFLVGYPSQHEGFVYFYAVTNAHVVREYGSPVIRLNTKEGGTDIFELTSDLWIPHPEGDDLAVVGIGGIEFSRYEHNYIHAEEMFASNSIISGYDIGIGDDVSVIGRFIKHDGGLINKPSIRFGSISMMPTVINFQGHDQECYLVEVRSLRGSSGSPVFVYMENAERRRWQVDPAAQNIPKANTWFLGVAFADVPYEEEVNQRVVDKQTGEETVEATSYYALSNSGQMAVIPAWRLFNFLSTDERLVMARKKNDEELAKRKAESALRPTGQKPKESGGMTKEDFHDALRRASQKVETENDKGDESR
jgi:hypothetical protein